MPEAGDAKGFPSSISAKPLSGPEWLLVGLIAYFVALKLLYALAAFPIADEAYYWLWGRHLQLSYFDHPPLQGWLQGLSYALFGRSLFALRWMTLAAFIGTAWIYLLIARHIGGAAWREVFLKGLLVYLASPLFGFFGSLAFNDYLLVFLMTASGYCFMLYLGDCENKGQGRLGHLFLGAILLGLAALTKYNGAFLGLAVAGCVFTRRALWPQLGRWPLYAAGLLAIAMQAPVLLWNISEGFASFRFHLVERNAGAGFQGLNFAGMLGVAVETLLMLGPVMAWGIARVFLSKPEGGFERAGKWLAIWCFWLSSLTFLYVANYSWVLWWWNIAAFVLVLPFAGKRLGRVALGLHVAWGLLINTLFIVNYTLLPTAALGARAIAETDTVYGWEEVVEAVEAAREQYRPDFVVANRYQTASQLAFALDDPNIVAISSRSDQFDYWFDAETHAGGSAVVLVYPGDESEAVRSAFERVTPIGTVPARFGDTVLVTYELLYAEGLRAP